MAYNSLVNKFTLVGCLGRASSVLRIRMQYLNWLYYPHRQADRQVEKRTGNPKSMVIRLTMLGPSLRVVMAAKDEQIHDFVFVLCIRND